ncbi:MAG: hypothetical protein KF795_20720 [Labilithrix sp.]|nr:hypothetical protein [Labilithrix sp.]
MYGQGHGHGYPYAAPPPPPPRSGPATLTIVLIALGALTVLGGGACVVVGGLVYLGATAEADGPVADPALPRGEATSTPGTPPGPSTPPTAEPAPLTGLVEADDDDDRSDDDRALAGDAPKDGASSGSASAPKTAGAGWLCNATGSVRVCGFANVCSNQMVSGLGSGADRFTASQSAKLACEGMARAKGGSTVCSVTCRPR